MRAYDDAKVAELVVLSILHSLKEAAPKIHYRLYRDKGLSEGGSGPKR